MANTTQPWLEDLSEEWVAQATPNSIACKPQDAAATQTSQSVPPKAKSRLPRLRQSSGSFSEIQVRSLARELRPPKQRGTLAERSLSDINVHQISSPCASPHAPSRSASYSFSSLSQDSVMYGGTVAHNTVAKSPVKDKGNFDTPEWRRRLVNGEAGYGNQTDLFGPTGLENIFQKPAESLPEEPKQPRRKLGLLKGLNAVPSSPPSWPVADQERDLSMYKQDDVAGQRHEVPNDLVDQLLDSEIQEEQDQVHAQAPQAVAPAARTISGQIEFENESFSPVYLTTTLRIEEPVQAMPNFRGSDLANRLRQIGSPPAPKYESVVEESALSQSREDSSFARIHDDSLPEGLPAGTPDLGEVGRFVELRRGGYSRDGSFRRRALSPSPEKVLSSRASHSKTTAVLSQCSRTDQTTEPKTPRRRENQFLSPERARNSGSPLKLFDAHDTFTSNRLQRRLSQLDIKSDKAATSSVKSGTQETTKEATKPSTLTSVEELSIVSEQTVSQIKHQAQLPFRVGSFGQGQLNEYEFSGDFSALSSGDFDAGHDSFSGGSPSIDVAPPGSRKPFKFHIEDSPMSSRASTVARRHCSEHTTRSIRHMSRPKFQQHRKSSAKPPPVESEHSQEYTEGKRGPTSPFKNPTPKRRRTINATEEGESDTGHEDDAFSDNGLGTLHRSHEAIQSVIGRKRKDARHDSSSNVADPETLSRRHILRPRNPTPSQRRRDEIHAEIMEATEAFILSSPKLNTIREHIEPSAATVAESEQARAKVVANEVAVFTMKRQAMREESRKRSVTTQDFLDEALKIMDFIRTKGRPTSGLGSLEETEAESEYIHDTAENASSSLTFERPPSREGRSSAWKEPNRHDLDSKVISHLQKYQEKDNDTFLNSSVNSIRFSRLRVAGTPEGESVVVEQDNIRITDNPNRHTESQKQEDDRIQSQAGTNGTQQSTTSSFGQTIATSASRRSDHVATLPPEAVAHLIPHEVAGMSFDREKNIWVRQKSPSKEHRLQEEEHSCLNESEEDPFGNIPDLTVDEMKECDIESVSRRRTQPTSETVLDDTEKADFEEIDRPVTREGKGINYIDTSSAPSKVSNFGWSYPKTETRATSWSTQAPRNQSTQKALHVQTTYAIQESEEDEIEHEIQYFEGRGHAPPSVQRRVRDITISFAEPEIQVQQCETAVLQEELDRKYRASSTNQVRGPKKLPTWNQAKGTRTLPHGISSQQAIFNGDGDLSLLDQLPSKHYQMQLSMSISAPMSGRGKQDTLMPAPSSPIKGDVTFMLSDLPEFTLNQVDELELPDRVIVKHNGAQFSKALEDRYAQGTASLVKALQDVEPDEPYWEDLRKVDLHKRDLDTLHRLDELCCQLEELDVSDNKIQQMEGVPYTMRRLRAQNNLLAGLTSWTHLINLQHLDISGNEIDSLDGLADLIHLRVLKANKNKIRSMDGVLHLDGLMELSASDNMIEMVDFGRANLKSLTDLDLHGNRILEVRNVHCLAQLQHLNLDDNDIEVFPLLDTLSKPNRYLRSLRLCRNGATTLDVDRHFPNLESLYVDGNSLTGIPGLEHLRYLRTLSGRDQILADDTETELCLDNFVRNLEVRNLYLSMNSAHTLDISQHMLSLQRLELASMGLQELPDNFGQLTPNIRSVNLNFNSIRDLRPLLNIKRLDELLLAGNKLERLRANALVLGKLGTLSKLDWRDNPLTLRFYAPASENRIMSLRHKPSDEQLTDRFVLPAGDMDTDIQHLTRLDYETRIRRRVTEMMLANLCKKLQELDGLKFDKTRVLVKDDVWERLLFLGVIQRKQPSESSNITE
ncbi:Protein nud1 [Coniothyrium glycines]